MKNATRNFMHFHNSVLVINILNTFEYVSQIRWANSLVSVPDPGGPGHVGEGPIAVVPEELRRKGLA